MKKNIPTKLKTLLALGVVTIATASSAVPASALSLQNCTNLNSKTVSCSNAKYKYAAKPNCSSKPELNTGNDNSGSTNKPDNNNCNNNSGSSNETNNNDNNGSTNETDNNNNGSGSTNETDNNNDNNGSGSTGETGENNNNGSGSTNEAEENNGNNNESQAGNFSAQQKEVVDLVNVERSKAGLSPLTLDSEISSVATKKSQDMIDNNYFDHNSPTYGSPFDMMKKFGISYKTAGENIAMGQKSPKEVVNAWMNSEGHRKNILNANFSKIGIGVAQKGNGAIYWTQMFVG
ncbi:CAP domain-containing protein [Metaclostridioides mangenotii]|uniref:CAP domain-containing protein n=1 Tax=Metaclostridioides mangenotii TaxID=1540 RepID=UPI0028EF90A4|nr:CAP domain-containing protein [Clostridioides mangenotii]